MDYQQKPYIDTIFSKLIKDDNFNEEQERGHKELAKELSISSDDDNQSVGNTECDANNKKDVDRLVDSQTSENGSKKNRSSRKDKSKKKSKSPLCLSKCLLKFVAISWTIRTTMPSALPSP